MTDSTIAEFLLFFGLLGGNRHVYRLRHHLSRRSPWYVPTILLFGGMRSVFALYTFYRWVYVPQALTILIALLLLGYLVYAVEEIVHLLKPQDPKSRR